MPPQLDELLARVDQCSTQAHELSAHFEDLREQIRQAISIAQLDPEMSLARSRKVLEYIIRDIYDDALKPKRAGTQPLEGLVQTLVREGQFPVRLAAYADMVRGLGNVGVHAFDKGVNSQDVLNSLSNLMPIVEWFFERRKMPRVDDSPLAAASRIDSAAPSSSGQRLAGTIEAEPRPRAKAEQGSSAVGPAAEPARAASKTSPPIESRWNRLKLWAIGVVPLILAACGIWYVTHRNVAPPVSTNTTVGQPVTPSAPNEISAKLSSTAATPGDASAKLPTITNLLGMHLTLIPSGEFTMGSPKGELGASDDEHPHHHVRITNAFYLGTYDVTRGQFAKFVAATSYKTDAETDGKGGWGLPGETRTAAVVQKPEFNWRNPSFPQTDNHPVVNVSWNDAMAFCKWLGDQEGKQYRLPTEAEWECACRAGTTGAYFFGDDPEDLAKYANVADAMFNNSFPDFPATTIKASDGYVFTAPVGSFLPNRFGLYDMVGNVWQWCSDWYGKDYYESSPPADPQGPATGSERVLRGGGWGNAPAYCRCSGRDCDGPADRGCYLSFRVVREP